ncbi:MAG: hypothetical protein ABL995_12380 [Bryobacteraceae bacterium]
MPYCCQCGKSVEPADRYCGGCGASQSAPPGGWPPPPPNATRVQQDPFSGISPRTASILCYVPWLGWIGAIIALSSDRFKRDLEVRFHAFQGLYLFVAWLIVDWVVSPVLNFEWNDHHGFSFGHPFARAGSGILGLLIIAAWIVMMIKASRGEHYRLPILGDLAERSVAEQRV